MVRTFAEVAYLLGDGDTTEANPGTFENVELRTGQPELSDCKEGEVIVDVKAACINYPDLLQTVGGYQHVPKLPFIPGQECAGVVSAVGGGMMGVSVGDRVACPGGMASSVVASAASCWVLPSHYSFAEGASFSTGYSTAYHCLVERGQLQPGETVLIHGATGGMGMAAVHIAKAIGATIIATGGSKEKLVTVREQGAGHTICYETEPRFRTTVKSLTDGRGADVIFDPVGGAVFDESMYCGGYGCRLLILGFTSGIRSTARTNHVLIKGMTLMGCRAGESVRQGQADGVARTRQLRSWAEEGKLRPHVSHVLPLAEVRQAFRLMWGRGVVGRIVVAPDGVEISQQRAAAKL